MTDSEKYLINSALGKIRGALSLSQRKGQINFQDYKIIDEWIQEIVEVVNPEPKNVHS